MLLYAGVCVCVCVCVHVCMCVVCLCVCVSEWDTDILRKGILFLRNKWSVSTFFWEGGGATSLNAFQQFIVQ